MLAPSRDLPRMHYVKGMSSLAVSQYYFTAGLRSTTVMCSLTSLDNVRGSIVTVRMLGLVLDPFNGVTVDLFSFSSLFGVALRGNVRGSNLVAMS